MKRLLVLGFFVALAACGVSEAPVSSSSPAAVESAVELTALERVRMTREEVFRSVNAASVEGFATYGKSYPLTDQLYEAALTGFDRGDLGVWCYDNAGILAERYRREGFEAVVVSFGLEPSNALGVGITHAGVLVKVDGQWLYQDAYFNFEIVTPFLEAIEQAARGQDLEFATGKNLVRRMRVKQPNEAMFQDPAADCSNLETTQTCDVVFKVDPHLTLPEWVSAFKLQEQMGLQGNITGLFRLPFAVYDGTAYMTDHSLLDEIVARSGCRGGPVASCAPAGL